MNKFIDSLLGLAIVLGSWSLLETFPIYWLWNWLMPSVFGLKTISFTQAFGLTILCALLFKSSIFSSSSNDASSSENDSSPKDGYVNEGLSA